MQSYLAELEEKLKGILVKPDMTINNLLKN